MVAGLVLTALLTVAPASSPVTLAGPSSAPGVSIAAPSAASNASIRKCRFLSPRRCKPLSGPNLGTAAQSPSSTNRAVTS